MLRMKILIVFDTGKCGMTNKLIERFFRVKRKAIENLYFSGYKIKLFTFHFQLRLQTTYGPYLS